MAEEIKKSPNPPQSHGVSRLGEITEGPDVINPTPIGNEAIKGTKVGGGVVIDSSAGSE